MVRHTGSSLIDEMGTASRPWMVPLQSMISRSKSSPELSGRLLTTNAGLINLMTSLHPHNIICSKEACEQEVQLNLQDSSFT